MDEGLFNLIGYIIKPDPTFNEGTRLETTVQLEASMEVIYNDTPKTMFGITSNTEKLHMNHGDENEMKRQA
ncbi:3577_t:CDS:2 [Funneliformis geosporum]|uniref:19218_t:CDS:1 n=1 Tax=Funneliformis geosporum TaxID=1117311 RepID=A0A9W4SEJ1_9GLOM|nr:19218_t:CDS:2 [Funneliformis geosporum]CAI2167535.1 3577_t:CDS:2 [Funneliformis geosporum]